MAQGKYGFFNSSGDDIRSYEASDMATAFHALASSGVAALDACLQVSAEGSTMRTLVGYGTAMLEGYYYTLRDDGGGVQAFSHTTEAELSRIDRIILRLNLAARTIALVKLIGTAASTPETPALTRDDETYELSLAQVLIRAGAEEILSSDITDERADDTVCGLIAPESLRRSEIAAMIAEEAADTVRFSEQTLETTEQEQARENIGAMQSIGESTSIQKGNGNGDTEDAIPGVDYGIPAVEVSTTLAAASWVGTEAPYTQTVAVSGMTASKKAMVGLALSATSAQYETALYALLRVTAQGEDTITVTAEGYLPDIDLPILVEIVG